MRGIIFSILTVVITAHASCQNLSIFKSHLGVGETTDKIEDIIEAKGLKFFETVSHHVIASEQGYAIDSTNIILFEDPALTSSLIQCEQTSALDLPMKIMVWEENDDVYIGYVDPQLMRKRFMIDGCPEVLASMTSMIVRVVNEAIKRS